MANKRLTADELVKARELLNDIRERLLSLAAGDEELLFAYRRKIAKELSYDERGTPAHRKKIKALKRKEQNGICPLCNEALPEKDCELDRYEARLGYTIENTRLVHHQCHIDDQAKKLYA